MKKIIKIAIINHFKLRKQSMIMMTIKLIIYIVVEAI